MYFLNYGGDLAAQGRIGWTKSADYGELFYFDWASEQWEWAMEHRTIRIELPIVVPREEVTRADMDKQVGFQHRAVREHRKTGSTITARKAPTASSISPCASTRKRGGRQTQRLQFYIPKAAVPMQAGVLSESTNAGPGGATSAAAPGPAHDDRAGPAAARACGQGPIAMAVTFPVLLAAGRPPLHR